MVDGREMPSGRGRHQNDTAVGTLVKHYLHFGGCSALDPYMSTWKYGQISRPSRLKLGLWKTYRGSIYGGWNVHFPKQACPKFGKLICFIRPQKYPHFCIK